MAKAKILVVDDDAALAEMIGIILNAEDYETIFCADPQGPRRLQALRKLQLDAERPGGPRGFDHALEPLADLRPRHGPQGLIAAGGGDPPLEHAQQLGLGQAHDDSPRADRLAQR